MMISRRHALATIVIGSLVGIPSVGGAAYQGRSDNLGNVIQTTRLEPPTGIAAEDGEMVLLTLVADE